MPQAKPLDLTVFPILGLFWALKKLTLLIRGSFEIDSEI
jgi:hypothetical protein